MIDYEYAAKRSAEGCGGRFVTCLVKPTETFFELAREKKVDLSLLYNVYKIIRHQHPSGMSKNQREKLKKRGSSTKSKSKSKATNSTTKSKSKATNSITKSKSKTNTTKRSSKKKPKISGRKRSLKELNQNQNDYDDIDGFEFGNKTNNGNNDNHNGDSNNGNNNNHNGKNCNLPPSVGPQNIKQLVMCLICIKML